MIEPNLGRIPNDAEWAGLIAREPADHFYAVMTTGIVCRHGCPARAPLRKNVRIFDTLAPAIDSGYRACKRCQPNTDHPVSRTNASIAAVPSLELP